MLNSSVWDNKLCPLLMKFVLNYSHCCRFLADLEKLIAYKEEAQRWQWNRYVTEVALEIFRSREEEYHPLLPRKIFWTGKHFRSREEEYHPLLPRNIFWTGKCYDLARKNTTHFFLFWTWTISDLGRKKATHFRCLRICEMVGTGLPLETSWGLPSSTGISSLRCFLAANDALEL